MKRNAHIRIKHEHVTLFADSTTYSEWEKVEEKEIDLSALELNSLDLWPIEIDIHNMTKDDDYTGEKDELYRDWATIKFDNGFSIYGYVGLANSLASINNLGRDELASLKSSLRKAIRSRYMQTQEEEITGLTYIDGRIRVVSLKRDGTFKLENPHKYSTNEIFTSFQEQLYSSQIDEFEELINSQKAKEHDLQKFFEKYPFFILNDMYQRIHPQLVLKSEDVNLRPDFILEPYNQHEFCDILEIKPPSFPIFIKKKNRNRYSAAVFEAKAQLLEYKSFFQENAKRNAIEKKYGLKFYRPRLHLIIGRTGKLDPMTEREIEESERDISIITYDKLLARAKNKLKAP